jgi:hypothetical protein
MKTKLFCMLILMVSSTAQFALADSHEAASFDGLIDQPLGSASAGSSVGSTGSSGGAATTPASPSEDTASGVDKCPSCVGG